MMYFWAPFLVILGLTAGMLMSCLLCLWGMLVGWWLFDLFRHEPKKTSPDDLVP